MKRGPLFAAPALAGLFLFLAGPFLLALVLSLTDYRLNSPRPWEVVGLRNYAEIFRSSAFVAALRNNFVFAAIVVPVQTGLALLVAVALDRPLRLRPLLRSLFFLPVVYPMSLVAVVWTLLYAPDGLINAAVGLSVDWLHDETFALPAIMILSIWQGLGFQTVILLAGLQQISPFVLEAAVVDGATPWQRFWSITLPLLRGPLLFTALVTTILSFRLFDQIHIMTQGGPGTSTTTVMYEIWRTSFVQQRIGAASAMTVVFFAVVLAVVLGQGRLSRRWS